MNLPNCLHITPQPLNALVLLPRLKSHVIHLFLFGSAATTTVVKLVRSAVSPTLAEPLEMCSLKVQLHQPPASLPCSHLPHPLGALYFLPPERMLWLEFHLVHTTTLPF